MLYAIIIIQHKVYQVKLFYLIFYSSVTSIIVGQIISFIALKLFISIGYVERIRKFTKNIKKIYYEIIPY